MAAPYHLYLVKVSFPSGDSAVAIKTITFPKNKAEVEKLHGEFARAVSQNEDVKIHWDSIKYVAVQEDPKIGEKYEAALAEMRKTFADPEKGEGLDKLNRLLADPTLSRKRADEKAASVVAPTEV